MRMRKVCPKCSGFFYFEEMCPECEQEELKKEYVLQLKRRKESK